MQSVFYDHKLLCHCNHLWLQLGALAYTQHEIHEYDFFFLVTVLTYLLIAGSAPDHVRNNYICAEEDGRP